MGQKLILKTSVLVAQNKKKNPSRHVIKITIKKTQVFKNEINQYFDANGYISWSKKEKKYIILGTNSPKNGLVQCPECHIGKLTVIRSYKTKKRFMGCSNYNNGCKASSPLLQKARLRAMKKACEKCGWPIILFRYSRKQKWIKQCSNFTCKKRFN